MARPTIKQGMSGAPGTDIGDAIALWRNYLASTGYGAGLAVPANASRIDFGAGTAAATKKWQTDHQLKNDGEIGPKGWAKYDEIQATPISPYAAYADTPAIKIAEAAAKSISTSAPASAAAVHAAQQLQAPTSAAAHSAAARLSNKTAPTSTPTPTTTGPHITFPKSGKEVVTDLERLYNATPVWLRIVVGAVSALATFTGIKKLVTK